MPRCALIACNVVPVGVGSLPRYARPGILADGVGRGMATAPIRALMTPVDRPCYPCIRNSITSEPAVEGSTLGRFPAASPAAGSPQSFSDSRIRATRAPGMRSLSPLLCLCGQPPSISTSVARMKPGFMARHDDVRSCQSRGQQIEPEAALRLPRLVTLMMNSGHPALQGRAPTTTVGRFLQAD